MSVSARPAEKQSSFELHSGPHHRLFDVLQRRSTLMSAALFLAALIFFAGFQSIVLPREQLWSDELFALWAGDPSLPFGQAFHERILPDTNAPIYFSLLYFAQLLVPDGRSAIIYLNAIVGSTLLATLLLLGWRKNILPVALLAAAMFLVGAPGLSYAFEGRVYAFAMLTCLNSAFLASACLETKRADAVDISVAAVLGVLSAWLHVYAALFSGALGAGLIVSGWLIQKRTSIVRLGLAFGVGAVIAFAFWIAIAYPMFSKTATKGFWLPFTREAILSELWGIKQYSIGITLAAPIGAIFVGASYFNRASRALVVSFAVSAFLFVAIPFVISLHTVIVLARYFLIAVPAFQVMLIFMVRSQIQSAALNARSDGSIAVATIGALFLLVSVATGPKTAWWHFQNRWDWHGIDTIEPLIGECTEGKVRVLNSSMRNLSGFGYFLRGRLAYVDASKAPVRDVSEIRCPVLGWAEHYLSHDDRTWVERATIEDALAEFHLTNRENLPLVIDRHPGGLVLRRPAS